MSIAKPEIEVGSKVRAIFQFEDHILKEEIYVVSSRDYGHIYVTPCSKWQGGRCRYNNRGTGCGGHNASQFELYIEKPITEEEAKRAANLPSVEEAISFFKREL